MGNKAMAGRLAPFSILDFVELRPPPLISHEETAPSSPRCRLYKPEPGSHVRKSLLPRVIELLRKADNPKFDQRSPVNGYGACYWIFDGLTKKALIIPADCLYTIMNYFMEGR